MKITLSNRVIINGSIPRERKSELVKRFPRGVETGENFLSLGRTAANFALEIFPDAVVNDLRKKAPLDCPPNMKFPPRKNKINLFDWKKKSGGFIFLPKSAFRRGIPNFIRNIAAATKEMCAVFPQNLHIRNLIDEQSQNMFPDWKTYSRILPENPLNDNIEGNIFFIFESVPEFETIPKNLFSAPRIFVIMPPSPMAYNFARENSCNIGKILYNSAVNAPIDYYPIATPFINAVRYLIDDDDKKRRLNLKDTIFNMISDDDRNDILIAQINNTRANSNIFLTKYISHFNKLLRPLEYLNPITLVPLDYSTHKEYEETIAKICNPQIELTGFNLFITFNDALKLGDKLPQVDNCYFLTPMSAAIAMKATKNIRKARSNMEGLKIFDFTDLRIRELSKMAAIRRNTFNKSVWTNIHSIQKKYI